MEPQPESLTSERWQTCSRPEQMLAWLPAATSPRKLRLFAVACCRQIWDLLVDGRSRAAVVASEEYAEGMAARAALIAAGTEARAVVEAKERPLDFPWPVARTGDSDPILQAARAAVVCTWTSAAHAARASAVQAARAARSASIDRPRTIESDMLCELLRDIIRDPTAPETRVDPLWQTSTVRAIARAIYTERKFADLPILADALEEAGCTDAALLAHCRERRRHCLGCWALDAILGKS